MLRDPSQYSKEVVGFPQSGQQAASSFLRIKTKSQSEFTLFKKKYTENNAYSSFEHEKMIGLSITKHSDYPKIKDFICLPIYNKKRASGNELLFRKKEMDLESCRNYLQQSRSEAVSYLFHQMKNSVDTLDFLHNNQFNDDKGFPRQGIIHGDIKPDNILLDKKGNFLLADFGCAHFSDQPIHQLGMLTYLSPELLKDAKHFPDKPFPNSDKNDIWSLGVSMKSLLTDEYPIQAPPNKESRLQANTLTEQGYVRREAPLSNRDSYLEKKSSTYNPSGYVTYSQMQRNQFDDSASFFSDNQAGELIRKDRAIAYLESTDIYHKNLNSKHIIKELCEKKDNDFCTDFSSGEIFDHLTSMMLLPAVERPSASELKEILNKLTMYIPENRDLNISFAKGMLENISQEQEKNQGICLLQKQNEATSSSLSESLEPFSYLDSKEMNNSQLIQEESLAESNACLPHQKKSSLFETKRGFPESHKMVNSSKKKENCSSREAKYEPLPKSRLDNFLDSQAQHPTSFLEIKNCSPKSRKIVNSSERKEDCSSREAKYEPLPKSRLNNFLDSQAQYPNSSATQIEKSEQSKEKRKAVMYRF